MILRPTTSLRTNASRVIVHLDLPPKPIIF